MKVVWRHRELGEWVAGLSFPWTDLELAPQGVDVLLVVLHARKLHHVIPDCRVCAVGSDHEVEVDFNLRISLRCERLGSVLEPRRLAGEIRARKLVVEEEAHIGHLLQKVQEAFVQGTSVDCKYGLVSVSYVLSAD